MEWKFNEARARLSEVFDRAANEGPQKVIRRGRPTMIIITEEDLTQRKLQKQPRLDFKEYLVILPDMSDLELERDKTPMREIEL